MKIEDRFDFYISGSVGGDWVVTELAKSLKKETKPVFNYTFDTIPVSWGILRGSDLLIKKAMTEEKDFIYIDHAYFNPGHRGESSFYRVVKNELQLTHFTKPWKRMDDRIKKFGIELKPWRKTGRNIIVCPPTQPISHLYDLSDEWLKNTIIKISQVSDRPIIIRRKPGEVDLDLSKGYALPIMNYVKEENVTSFEELLEDAYVVVAFNSSAAITAIINGIPVIVDKTSSASYVGKTSILDIDNLYYGDRWDWLGRLSYGQVSPEEMRSGFMWDILGIK